MKKHLIIYLTLLILSFNAYGCNSVTKSDKFYAVIFGVTVNLNGELQAVRIVKVIDPITSSKDPVNIPIPDSFIESARKIMIKKKYNPEVIDGKPKEFFTYFYYDPNQPSRADFDPKKEI